MTIDQQLLDLARRKARASFAQYSEIHLDPFLLLAADTEVIALGAPLGKPESETQAIAFLKLLSGCTHQVKTAVVILNSRTQEEVSHLETTEIEFRELSDSEILDYVKTGEGFDKAGGYGIQGLASQFVKQIRGSWTNVVGLPMESLLKIFEDKKWSIQS